MYFFVLCDEGILSLLFTSLPLCPRSPHTAKYYWPEPPYTPLYQSGCGPKFVCTHPNTCHCDEAIHLVCERQLDFGDRRILGCIPQRLSCDELIYLCIIYYLKMVLMYVYRHVFDNSKITGLQCVTSPVVCSCFEHILCCFWAYVYQTSLTFLLLSIPCAA